MEQVLFVQKLFQVNEFFWVWFMAPDVASPPEILPRVFEKESSLAFRGVSLVGCNTLSWPSPQQQRDFVVSKKQEGDM